MKVKLITNGWEHELYINGRLQEIIRGEYNILDPDDLLKYIKIAYEAGKNNEGLDIYFIRKKEETS